MSGIISTGTSIQKGVTLKAAATATYKWQHNKGVNPVAVRVVKASDGQPVADAVVAFDSGKNFIRVSSTAGVVSPGANILVEWDVTTLEASSLAGLPGSPDPSTGFSEIPTPT